MGRDTSASNCSVQFVGAERKSNPSLNGLGGSIGPGRRGVGMRLTTALLRPVNARAVMHGPRLVANGDPPICRELSPCCQKS